jgi:multiple antibiotic resistance protein
MIDAFLAIFVPLFIIVNPSSTLALFSAITGKYSKEERKKTAKNTIKYASILLIIFAITGSGILEYMGIQIYSLRIAGGILLVFVGLDMTRRGQQFGETPPGKDQKTDYSLVPLAMPSLAGPGAITVTIVSMKVLPIDYNISWWMAVIIAILAILLTLIITYLIFLSSTYVIRVLGEKGMDAFTRVMGLLTVGIAIQFMFKAIEEWLKFHSFL